MSLSLAMIVKNEARDLPRCLASVRGLVDEVVVLDTGSSDGTAELAASLGAQVHAFAWIDDFSAARNAALARCRGEWILVLDADETIDAGDHGKLREAQQAADVQGWFLTLRDYFRSGTFIGIRGPVQPNPGGYREGAEYGHQLSYEAVRLFRAQPGPVFQGRIHELAEQYFQQRSLPLGRLPVVIHHFGKVDPTADQVKQSDYTRLARLEAEAHADDPMAHYNLVQQGLRSGDWAEVLAAAQAYLRLVEKVPLLVYLGAARACLALGKAEEAMPFLEPILRGRPDHAVALQARAKAKEALGALDQAEADLLRAMESEPTFTLPFLDLARLLDRQERWDQARAVLEAGLDQNPKDEVLWAELVGLSARRAPDQAGKDAWDALQALPDGGRGIWHGLVLHALLAQGDRDGAQEVLRRGLDVLPGNPELLAWRERLA